MEEKLKEYSKKDVETMYKETLEKLKNIFKIPEDLSNKIVNIKYGKGEIYLEEKSIFVTTKYNGKFCDVVKSYLNKDKGMQVIKGKLG